MTALSQRLRVAVMALGVLAASVLWPALACADSVAEQPSVAAASPQPASAPPAAEKPKLDTGDNAWVLTSSALVLMMTGPGLALFYCGLVRKKNVAGRDDAVRLPDGPDDRHLGALGLHARLRRQGCPCVGNLDYLFMKGIAADVGPDGQRSRNPHAPGLPDDSRLTHMLFQGMFFIITPALICGAFAERMKFSTMVVFMILWGTLVYCPLCHWVWGGGILAYGESNAGRLSAGRWTLPAARWSISAPACRPWSAPWCSASGSASAASPCRRIT